MSLLPHRLLVRTKLAAVVLDIRINQIDTQYLYTKYFGVIMQKFFSTGVVTLAVMGILSGNGSLLGNGASLHLDSAHTILLHQPVNVIHQSRLPN